MRSLSFKPSESEQIFIEDKGINWSEYCHAHLERDMHDENYNRKYILIDKFQIPLVMISIGLLLFLLGVSNIESSFVLYICYVLSIATVSFGIISIFVGGIRHG